MIKQWYEFRRHLAWSTLALWAWVGLGPIAAIAKIWLSGRPYFSATETIIRAALPIALFTGSALFAVKILRTRDPDRSRTQAWRLVISFAAGLAAYFVGAYVYGS